jgi:hypothetical protein
MYLFAYAGVRFPLKWELVRPKAALYSRATHSTKATCCLGQGEDA